MMLALASQLFVVKRTATISRQPPEDQWYENSTSSVVTPPQELFDCSRDTTECSLPTIVNYQDPLIEFSISFDCSLAPFTNEHSQKVFRKVASYKLDGRAVCCGVGIGLQYLHFPQNIKLLALDGYCLRSLPAETFGQFIKLERLQISASRINHLSSVCCRELGSLQELELENNEFGTMEQDSMDGLVQLQRLRVWNCTGVDFSIGKLEKLQVLELEQSMVKNISSIFNSIPSSLTKIHSTGVMSDEDPWIAVQPAVEEIAFCTKLQSSSVS
ncbi:AGAP004899-PA-like protein [Anopheles sinensis]|uniref:AGAP004899-PA-like protein n=1 Tax=Anopheles sinensis TaxID=74873 RepID=A0A084VQF1_ANOSI|nr:AGAP004899-PA-like protein [Anopheles sinensis]